MSNYQKSKPAKVFHFDLYGKREAKYDFLNNESLGSIPWTELDCPEPYHFFVPKDFTPQDEYEKGFRVDDIFSYSNSGLQTKNDELTIHFKVESLRNVLTNMKTLNSDDLRKKYSITKDGRDWTIDLAKKDIINNPNGVIFTIQYKPFDYRLSYFTGNSKGFLAYPRKLLTASLLQKNYALATMRQISGSIEPCQIFITKYAMTDRAMYSTNGTPYLFPLYLYQETNGQQKLDQTSERTPNLNLQIVAQISDKLGLPFTSEKDVSTSSASGNPGAFAPIDLLDYIYAVLHSPTYREKYKEFLKIDFPRVPYPEDVATFWQLVSLGGELRQIHLLESPIVSKYITQYPVGGSNEVGKVRYENGNVWINDTQYFANVPQVAWGFYIGGYQPAQKWLKDRKGRKLEFDDVLHYQKIIVALSETDRIMTEINKIGIESHFKSITFVRQ